jgi:hypothetical protein
MRISLHKEASRRERRTCQSIDIGLSLGQKENRKTGDGYIAIDYLNKSLLATKTGGRLGQQSSPSRQNATSLQEGPRRRKTVSPQEWQRRQKGAEPREEANRDQKG